MEREDERQGKREGERERQGRAGKTNDGMRGGRGEVRGKRMMPYQGGDVQSEMQEF